MDEPFVMRFPPGIKPPGKNESLSIVPLQDNEYQITIRQNERHRGYMYELPTVIEGYKALSTEKSSVLNMGRAKRILLVGMDDPSIMTRGLTPALSPNYYELFRSPRKIMMEEGITDHDLAQARKYMENIHRTRMQQVQEATATAAAGKKGKSSATAPKPAPSTSAAAPKTTASYRYEETIPLPLWMESKKRDLVIERGQDQFCTNTREAQKSTITTSKKMM